MDKTPNNQPTLTHTTKHIPITLKLPFKTDLHGFMHE